TMAPKSLLRHIFRHGPRRSLTSSPHDSACQSIKPPSLLKQVLSEADLPDSPLAYKSRPDSQQSSVLEDIAEESNSDADTEVPIKRDNSLIAETLAALDLDISTFTTRDLILSTVDEARLAVHMHLDTISSTLALLDSLEGFSATIAVLKEKMVEKTRVCEGKLGTLDHVEWAVGQMQFGAEEQEVES
ncbi:hypothetical protein EK21DRAFT_79988, partial [Setomelanomma holmii]